MFQCPFCTQSPLVCADPQEAMLGEVALWKEFLQSVERESSLPRALWKKKRYFQICLMHICRQEDYGTCAEVCTCPTSIQELSVCARRKWFSSLERHQLGSLTSSGGK